MNRLVQHLLGHHVLRMEHPVRRRVHLECQWEHRVCQRVKPQQQVLATRTRSQQLERGNALVWYKRAVALIRFQHWQLEHWQLERAMEST